MGPREVVLSTVVPVVVGLVVYGLLSLFIRNGSRRADGPASSPSGWSWAVPLMVAGGVVLGSWAWQTRIELWADAVTHRFPAIALAALLAGLASTLTPLRTRPLLAAIPAVLGGGFAAWAVLGGLHESLISEPARWGWVAGVAVLSGVHAWSFEAAGRALPGWRGPVLLWLLFGVAALGATAGFANAPLVLWPVSGVVFALILYGLTSRGVNLLAGCGPALAVVLAGAVSFSHWFGDRERWVMFALLMASPVGLGLAALPALRARPIARLVVPGLVALGLAGAQAAVALPALIEASGGGDEYEYDY